MPAAPKTGARPCDAVDGDERIALCALAALPGIGTASLDVLREAHGSLAAAAARGGAELAKTPGLREDGARALAEAGDLGARGRWLVDRARELGARILTPADADWPARLRAVEKGAPPLLYVLGSLPESARRVALVGSRRVDGYGRRMAGALAERLCAAGVEVVSGGADGVDREAHRGALAAGGRTVAVVGTGLLKPYPPGSVELYPKIAQRGAVVSEFALDAGGQTHHFPRRNRTIAGLSEAVVLVRGRADSGARSTVEAATKLGRPVFAVPGQVGDALAALPLELLASGGASCVVDGGEVLRALGLAPALPPLPAAEPADEVAAPLSEGAQRLRAALQAQPRHVDELAAEAALSPAQALAELLRLELAGLCAARPGKYFSRR